MLVEEIVPTMTRPSWRVWALAAVAGLAGGVLTSFGQTVLGGGWAALTNSASPWVMIAFAAGAFVPGRWGVAMVAGVLTQVGLVAGYYATTELRGFAAGMAAIVIWVAAGAVAGPLYGAAGSLVRYGVRSPSTVPGRDDEPHPTYKPRVPARVVRSVAAGVVGSVWIMEGLNFFNLARDVNSNSGPGVAAAWVYIGIGVALPPLLARTTRERLYALAVLVVAAGLAVAAGMVINAAFLF